ncbi:MAG TPA: hypothetical protein VNQ90_14540 [Chthoniobacteraceae bacterium]|nr:hypothetical protein [Chthoniobacteraceae bacterium]
MGSDLRRTSISLPPEVFEQGQLIARLRRRSFSNYIADLIASDLETTEALRDRLPREREGSPMKKAGHK